MRLNINLATKPYQDVQRILRHWGPLVLLLAACTAGLLWMAVDSWQESRGVSAKIAALHSEIAELDHQHEQALELLRLPQNVPVLNSSKFLNGLIARKSFSWTRVFMQLEQIMPLHLRVLSISPELQPSTNTVLVHLTVAGTSRESALELVRRLEQSSSFRDARIEEETEALARDKPTDAVQFHLTAVYVPQASRPAGAPNKAAEAGSGEKNGPQGKAAQAGAGQLNSRLDSQPHGGAQ